MKIAKPQNNSINELSAKEQFIVRELLMNKSFSSLTKYNHDKLETFNKLFNQQEKHSSTYFHTWDRIQAVLRLLLKKNVIEFTTEKLSKNITISGKDMFVRTYVLKQYWKTMNSFELREFKTRNNIEKRRSA